MTSVNLSKLIANQKLEESLAFDAKHRNVPAMAQLLSEGTCPTSAINVLHYDPEHVTDVLDATRGLSQKLRKRTQEILRAMCNRLGERQREIYEAWQRREAARLCREAASAACQEIALILRNDKNLVPDDAGPELALNPWRSGQERISKFGAEILRLV